MPRLCLASLAALVLLAVPALAAPPGQGWNYLPNDDIGAVDFKRPTPRGTAGAPSWPSSTPASTPSCPACS